jgi:ribosomal protein L4
LKTALRRAISDLATKGTLHTGSTPSLKAAKTKELIGWIKDSGLPLSCLIITSKQPEQNLLKAAQNLREVDLRTAREVNAEDLLRRRQVWVSEDAWSELGKRLQNKSKGEAKS